MHRLLFKVLTLVTFFASTVAFSQSDVTRLVTGNDSKGWDAVGRLEIRGQGFCTATLIAPDRVLTAAHCLFDSDSLARVRDSDIVFKAGWRGSRATATAQVRKSFLHPKYAYDGPSEIGHVWNDLAILVLEAPIRKSSITPLALGSWPSKGTEVGVISYAHDRSEFATLEDGCHVLSRPRGTLVLSCSVDFGSSGAPIFVMSEGVPKIVSVVSAKAEVRGRPVSLGTGMEKPLEVIADKISAENATLTSGEPKVRRLELGGSGSSGPKFVRP